MSAATERNYGLVAPGPQEMPAPELPYRPPMPKRLQPRLALIGCGGISANHLAAYRDAGWRVVALCDRDATRARQRRDEFAPEAAVFTDHQELLAGTDAEVVDVALHPEPRVSVMRDVLRAGRHVLSQKPFVKDLDTGRELIALAQQHGVKLAVNQNGRWAPYASYARHAVAAGLIGAVQTVTIRIHWDHTWCKGTPFERLRHLILFDFGIHWFDLCAQFFAQRPMQRVFAQVATAPGQEMEPPMLAQACVQFENGLATLLFDGHSRHGPEESIAITGSRGTLRTRGPVLANDQIELFTDRGVCRPKLEGHWFNDGFRGAMGELLCALEENREPAHSAADNLRSLELCFAARKSADTGLPQP
jgi:predicted dehydrogenase